MGSHPCIGVIQVEVVGIWELAGHRAIGHLVAWKAISGRGGVVVVLSALPEQVMIIKTTVIQLAPSSPTCGHYY